MLKFGAMHAASMYAMNAMKREIEQGEAAVAGRKEELAHFAETMEALMGITDPESVPEHLRQAANDALAAAGNANDAAATFDAGADEAEVEEAEESDADEAEEADTDDAEEAQAESADVPGVAAQQ